MYEGEYGPGMRKAITMLIEYGNVWDAGRLVKVHNAHVGLGGGEWLDKMLVGVERIRAFTTTHAGMSGDTAGTAQRTGDIFYSLERNGGL